MRRPARSPLVPHPPPFRRLAEYLGTSKRPVQMAYGRLVEEGLLDSAIGVGTWVRSGQVVDPAAVSGASRAAGVVLPEAGRLEGDVPVPVVSGGPGAVVEAGTGRGSGEAPELVDPLADFLAMNEQDF